MILARLDRQVLRNALLRVARPDEDVVWRPRRVRDAAKRGFPRLLVSHSEIEANELLGPSRDTVPRIILSPGQVLRWEVAWRREAIGRRSKVEYLAERVGPRIASAATRDLWVDSTLAALARAVGRQLPPSLVGMARRVMEYPSRYSSLEAVAGATELGRGALKARFCRRAISPYRRLRWFRILAVAELLADTTQATGVVARRLGYSSGGNLVRTVEDTTGLTTSELRTRSGRQELILRLAHELLSEDELERWTTLDGLFTRGVA